MPGTRNRAIAALDVNTGLHVPAASIKGQAARTYIYGKDGLAENAFCEIETKASAVLAAAIQSRRPPLMGTRDHAIATMFIALQHGRTPAAAAELEATSTGLTRAILKFPGTVPAEFQDKISQLRVTHEQAELFEARLALQFAPVLHDLASVLVIDDSPVEFVCPDTGVVFHNQWAKAVRGLGVLGYACSGLQIFLPVSSRALLCRYDSATYEVRRGVKTVQLTQRKDVSLINRLLCSCAERLVYFSGNAQTLQGLQENHKTLIRKTRAQLVSTDRFGSTTGRQQIVGYHMGQTIEAYQLSWLRIKRSVVAVPIAVRGQSFRPKATQAAELVWSPSKPLPEDLEGQEFLRLPD